MPSGNVNATETKADTSVGSTGSLGHIPKGNHRASISLSSFPSRHEIKSFGCVTFSPPLCDNSSQATN